MLKRFYARCQKTDNDREILPVGLNYDRFGFINQILVK
jgi:hypothetical protein